MVFLEDKLLHAINAKAKDQAQQIYLQITNSIKGDDLDAKSKLGSMKNYLITLNSIIYMSCRNHFICKRRLMCIRNQFTEKIGMQSCIKDVILLGEEMVEYYIRVIQEHGSTIKNPTIKDALDYIKANLEKDLTLEEVSEAIHVSKSHLSFLFSKCTGYSFSYSVNKLKIEKAKTLLKDSKLSLLDIALECGFNSQSYFSRVFSQFEGITPKLYRIYHTSKNASMEA